MEHQHIDLEGLILTYQISIIIAAVTWDPSFRNRMDALPPPPIILLHEKCINLVSLNGNSKPLRMVSNPKLGSKIRERWWG